ncbi:hypothetical protein SPI_05185 [Niveomyces insectorum RCEF 264]|uniref:Uncharacterized protein n=1 Tax=Niveomyces insectorum RCEF 264 TaxID=1081102 RepID=A0A167U1J3_9HYPO|nr:hypothetical protein SPI_05185 [Niveomyces insectorum RCEF 264]
MSRSRSSVSSSSLPSSHSSSSRSSRSSGSEVARDVRSIRVAVPKKKSFKFMVWTAGAAPGRVSHIQRDDVTYTVETHRGNGRRDSNGDDTTSYTERTKTNYHLVGRRHSDMDSAYDNDGNGRVGRDTGHGGYSSGHGGRYANNGPPRSMGTRGNSYRRSNRGAAEYGGLPAWMAGASGPGGPGGQGSGGGGGRFPGGPPGAPPGGFRGGMPAMPPGARMPFNGMGPPGGRPGAGPPPPRGPGFPGGPGGPGGPGRPGSASPDIVDG